MNSTDTLRSTIVLSLDAGYRAILDSLPKEFVSEVQATRDPQRHFILEGIHNRILRLHRPFLTRGYRNEKFRYSTKACLKSAEKVISSSHKIVDMIRRIWYCYSHVMGAAIVCFADLFNAIDLDLQALFRSTFKFNQPY